MMNEEKKIYRTRIELDTGSKIEEFVDICSKIPVEVTVKGKDENGGDWSLSVKSFLCTLVMKANLEKKYKKVVEKADWNTIYVECEEDIYNLISKFAI